MGRPKSYSSGLCKYHWSMFSIRAYQDISNKCLKKWELFCYVKGWIFVAVILPLTSGKVGIIGSTDV